jgi:choline dehydrogenase-like flavoprotein
MAATSSNPPAVVASADWLTPDERSTLEIVCETLIPAASPPDGEADPYGLYARSARAVDVARLMAETIGQEDAQSRAEFKQLLGVLHGPMGGMLLTGRPRGLRAMSPARREAALRAMANHRLGRLRQGFQALKRLATFIFYSAPDAGGTNPNWPAVGFTPPPPPPSPEAAPRHIRPLPVTGDLELSADAVIVGSGAGGGVMAAELTAAGKDVVILEKGGYYSESDFNGREADMMPQLYLRRGLLSTRDLGMSVLAGSCLGGGTVVNWSTSLRAPDYVLDEWERQYGLDGVTGPEFAHAFDVVAERIGVNTDDSEPNRNNAALERGCQALGYAAKRIPRNASDCRQRCGACGYGCPYGRKQSTLLTSLRDAHERGARVVVRCQVERVLVRDGRAIGVEGWAPDEMTGARRKVVVRAAAVVVAAGSVESPALLLRSGLSNPNIGRHLRLHPVASVAGFYEEPIEAWTGSLQTVYSDQFMRLRGDYGVWFELAPGHPGLIALATPWDGGREHKRQMARAAHEAAFIVLARDSGEGEVTLNREREPVITYWPNALDRAHLVRGMQEVARVAVAGGAVAVGTLHTPQLLLEAEGGRPGAMSEARLAAFTRAIAERGIIPNRPTLFTAHQMGTCRMGRDARTAVADPRGAVHGVRGLFIADASACPTAVGVNPMLTTMALAYRVAQTVKERC